MSPQGIPVARILGFEIRISLAWVLLLALVVLLGAEQATAVAPDLAAGTAGAIGGGVALAFLVSVLAHELAHAVVGRRRGLQPGPIVLGFVGGLAPLDIEARSPRDELVIALAGPALSGVLAAVAAGGALSLGSEGTAGAVGGGLAVIAALNTILAVLSLLPGMPLDGGRVVRAIAWWRTGSQDRAQATTAAVGRVAGWVLAGAGIALAFTWRTAEGLMILSLGWFIATGARALERRSVVQAALRDIPVRDVMERDVPHLGGSLTLDTFADRLGGDDGRTSLPVVDGAAPLGVVGLTSLRRIARRAWATTRAADVMAVPPQAPFLAPDDSTWAALEQLQRSGVDGLAVVEQGAVTGMLTRRAAARAIRSRLGQGAEVQS